MMNRKTDTPRTLLVGIGSPNGDDRVGWEIAKRLMRQHGPELDVRQAAYPGELVDWLEGVEHLIICDGFTGACPAGTICHWRWPANEIRQHQFSGSHDMPLSTVLELAEQLGRLPPRVTIWGVAIGGATPGSDM